MILGQSLIGTGFLVQRKKTYLENDFCFHHRSNKTKVLSVQLGKTFSFVKFVVEWGGVGGG